MPFNPPGSGLPDSATPNGDGTYSLSDGSVFSKDGTFLAKSMTSYLASKGNPAGQDQTGAASFTDPSQYGFGNFSPSSQASTQFYTDLAGYYAGQQAPQMQRTGVDWSGNGASPTSYGSTQPYNPMQGYPSFPGSGIMGDPITRGITSAQNAPVTYPDAPILSTPPGGGISPEGGATIAQGAANAGRLGLGQPPPPPAPSGGGMSPMLLSGGDDLNTRPGGPGGSGQTTLGGRPVDTTQNQLANAGSLDYRSPLSISNPAILGATRAVVSAANPPPPAPPPPQAGPAMGGPSRALPAQNGAQTTLGGRPADTTQNQNATPNSFVPMQPAPPPPPSTGQYSNPLFQQAQRARGVQEGVMGGLSSPDMYRNAQQGTEQSSRAQEMGVMGAINSPDMYRNPEQGAAAGSRDQQMGLVNRLNSDLSGNQPSLAEMQLRRGTDSSIAAAQALAASGGPGGSAAAARRAANQAAVAGQSLSGQSAALRAQEYAQARGELGSATQALRGQDLQNLGMSYQNATSQAGLAAQQSQALRSQDLQNLGMSYNNTTQQAQLQTQQSQAMRAQDLQATGMSYQNALAQAQFEQEQNAQQAQLEAQQRGLNAQMSGQYYGMANANMNTDLASRMHYMDLMASKYANDKGLAQQAGQFNTQQSNLMTGAAMNAAGAALPLVIKGLASDERLKTDVEDADPKELSDFLGKLNEKTFRYKDTKFGEGQHAGIMAQDMERSRIGKLIVFETPEGKMLDMRKALGALLAAGAVQEKRLRKLEAR